MLILTDVNEFSFEEARSIFSLVPVRFKESLPTFDKVIFSFVKKGS